LTASSTSCLRSSAAGLLKVPAPRAIRTCPIRFRNPNLSQANMSGPRLSTNPYKGTRDFYPEDMVLRNWFLGRMREVAERYGYEEYSGPIVELFDLYAAKSGEELVREQIYHFEDKGKRRLAIRPEVTPSVARMVAARLEQLVFPLRWYTIANLMRYERPQKGRLREHWQLNMDIFGEPGIRADLEILSVIVDLLLAFGADSSMFRIRVSDRRLFNDVLRDALGADQEQVQAISKAVDKRSKISKEEYKQWLAESGIRPGKIALLDEVSALSLEELIARLRSESRGAADMRDLFALLGETGLAEYCDFDFSIVRGFDYYTGTVFEVYDNSPENRRALFGGGRYDDLIGLFKKADVPGVGFGFGDVTFQDFLEIHDLIPVSLGRAKGVLIVAFEETPYAEYVKIARELRAAGIACGIFLDPKAKLKKQLAYAEKKGFAAALLAGPEEMEKGTVVLKELALRRQVVVSRTECLPKLKEWLGT